MESRAEELLAAHDIKPTPNRLLVLRALLASESPSGLSELVDALPTLEKSSIFRVLNLFTASRLVHAVEDGRGLAKYEVCHSLDEHSDEDLHPHFYCERCRRTFCLNDLRIPPVDMPAGFEVKSVNYMIKGICPDCG